jgi:hypothetical protein
VAQPVAKDLLAKNEEPMPAERAPQPPAPSGCELPDGPESLAALSVSIGLGLAVLGLFAGILTWLEPLPSADAATLAPNVGRGVRAGWLVLAFAFAGWVAWSVLRLTARLLRQRPERDARRLHVIETELTRATRLLERIAEVIERRGETGGFEPARSPGRAQALGEIDAALRGTQWALAESLLETFEAAYPGDPKSSSLRAALDQARRSVLEQRTAELAAAREVNDPARVIELYRLVAPELDREARGELQAGVARWFLTLIYRRLRTGKIQVEVVDLATQFAESFAATTVGASVLAALPMMRRSAGLCPRCAQPYTGVEQACPECLRPTGKVAPALGPAISTVQPE